MHHRPDDAPALDLAERGAPKDGAPQRLDRRLFMQLLVLDVAPPTSPTSVLANLKDHLEARGVEAVLYADLNDPRAVALLTWAEDPSHFVQVVRPILDHEALASVTARRGWTMTGRAYSTGYEDDLEFWMLERPRAQVLDPARSWAVWYPLRRKGPFNRLDPRERGGILREHGTIGRSYGEAGLASDVRLACHGIDAGDNEFVIGLVGGELYPLSHLVQAMRATRQTAEHMEAMGPFFVGRKLWQNPAQP